MSKYMKRKGENMTYQKAYEICLQKLEIHMEHMKERTYDLFGCTDGDYYAHENDAYIDEFIGSWVASFVTGMAPIAYQTHGDDKYLQWADTFAEQYRRKVFETPQLTMHDLGFLYLPYSVALYKLTGDKKHRETALKAADELAKRFNIHCHFIEAWDEMTKEKKELRGIVDSMMNLPLLLWAWKETEHTFYRDVAVACLETIKDNYLREDGSVCHAFLYDEQTGKVKCEANTCGYANGSHWARGTSWFVYGMAIAYSYTKDVRYLKAAEKAAKKFIECLTEEDSIPVWDFRLPKELPAKNYHPNPRIITWWDESLSENKKYNRDTSAAAIMVCAFQLLYEQTKDDFYQRHSQRILQSLCECYVDTNEKIPGMLKCGNGQMAYVTYGDYYLVQALAYELHQIHTCWYV